LFFNLKMLRGDIVVVCSFVYQDKLESPHHLWIRNLIVGIDKVILRYSVCNLDQMTKQYITLMCFLSRVCMFMVVINGRKIESFDIVFTLFCVRMFPHWDLHYRKRETVSWSLTGLQQFACTDSHLRILLHRILNSWKLQSMFSCHDLFMEEYVCSEDQALLHWVLLPAETCIGILLQHIVRDTEYSLGLRTFMLV
jgi:hypothetical protein